MTESAKAFVTKAAITTETLMTESAIAASESMTTSNVEAVSIGIVVVQLGA